MRLTEQGFSAKGASLGGSNASHILPEHANSAMMARWGAA